MHNRRSRIEPKEKPVIQNIGYTKETSKEYLDEALLDTARTYNIIDSNDDRFRNGLEKDLNSMSL